MDIVHREIHLGVHAVNDTVVHSRRTAQVLALGQFHGTCNGEITQSTTVIGEQALIALLHSIHRIGDGMALSVKGSRERTLLRSDRGPGLPGEIHVGIQQDGLPCKIVRIDLCSVSVI